MVHKVSGASKNLKKAMVADITLAVSDTAAPAGSAVSQRLMLKKWRSELKCEAAADALQTYFQNVGGLCTRVEANWAWQWGCPTHNNASECSACRACMCLPE